MDAIGPRKVDGFDWWIIIVIDHYSRYGLAQAVRSFTSAAARDFLARRWIASFGVPHAVLTDQGRQFVGEPFRSFVTEELKAQLFYASAEYPQGNGINESCHRILEHMIKTSFIHGFDLFEDVVNDCMLLYNLSPHSQIGDTPASLVFGFDLHLPGLESFENVSSEDVRLSKLREYRLRPLLEKILTDSVDDSQLRNQKLQDGAIDFVVGDIVTYRLNESEARKIGHVSGVKKYQAVRSFPCRVLEVGNNFLQLRHLWVRFPDRRAPKAECKRLMRFIPDLMREQAQRLFPTAPWVIEGEDGSARRRLRRPSIEGLTWGELQDRFDSKDDPSARKKRRRSTTAVTVAGGLC